MIASKHDSLCMSLLKAKYKVRQGWLYANRPKIYSPIWKAIKDTKSIIVKGPCYQLSDGSSINVWNDPWVSWLQNFKPKPRLDPITETPLMESQLIDHDLHMWNTNLVNHNFYAQFAQAVLSIAISTRNRPDTIIWIPDPKGKFFVRSAYRISTSHIHTNPSPNIKWMKL